VMDTDRVTAAVPCRRCGDPFLRLRRPGPRLRLPQFRCSLRFISSAIYCLACPGGTRRERSAHLCPVCGSPSGRRRTCGPECRKEHDRRRARVAPARVARRTGRPRGRPRRSDTICACGKEHWPWRNGSHPRADCGCGIAVRSAARRRGARLKAAHTLRIPSSWLVPVFCPSCGEEKDLTWYGGRAQTWLCLRCIDERKAEKDRTGRRCLAVHFPMDVLYARDLGRCYFCREVVSPVSRILRRGMKDPLGPTREHITPRCHGGGDSWDNITLAHRGCNSSDGAHLRRRAG
jgi:hypothetical protein